MFESETFHLQSKDFGGSINEAWKKIRDEKDFYDVTLACDDNQIGAHKVIISACSPILSNLLKRNPHQHPLLYLRGIKYSHIVGILDFVYQGEVSVPQEELHDFLAVANDLKVLGLYDAGEEIEEDQKLSEENEHPKKKKRKRSLDSSRGIETTDLIKKEQVVNSDSKEIVIETIPEIECLSKEDYLKEYLNNEGVTDMIIEEITEQSIAILKQEEDLETFVVKCVSPQKDKIMDGTVAVIPSLIEEKTIQNDMLKNNKNREFIPFGNTQIVQVDTYRTKERTSPIKLRNFVNNVKQEKENQFSNSSMYDRMTNSYQEKLAPKPINKIEKLAPKPMIINKTEKLSPKTMSMNKTEKPTPKPMIMNTTEKPTPKPINKIEKPSSRPMIMNKTEKPAPKAMIMDKTEKPTPKSMQKTPKPAQNIGLQISCDQCDYAAPASIYMSQHLVCDKN